uniref:Uncharacterized protein n=1 Tax=Rhizophora mucronata TaxID=61149 RepID=A0A2P2QRM9_RHIMU
MSKSTFHSQHLRNKRPLFVKHRVLSVNLKEMPFLSFSFPITDGKYNKVNHG